MSQPQSAVTYEGVLELIRQVTEQMKVQSEETTKQMRMQSEETTKQMRIQSEETERKFQAAAEQMKAQSEETERKIRATNQLVGGLGSRVGDIIECMVGGGKIVAQFKALGHNIITHSRSKNFGEEGTEDSGEIDLYLENGDIAVFIEVKTKLTNSDVLEHVERIRKYREWIETKGGDKRRFVGAVAGAVVERHVAKFALKKGFYVIVQTGVDTEIIAPKEFVPKEW